MRLPLRQFRFTWTGGGKRHTLTTLNFYSVVASGLYICIRCERGRGETMSLKCQTLNYIFIRISRKQHSGGLKKKAFCRSKIKHIYINRLGAIVIRREKKLCQ